MKLLLYLADVFEYGSDEEGFDFPIKGHDLNDDEVIAFLNSEIEDHNVKIKKITKKIPQYYSTSRYFEGQLAEEEGSTCFINFHSLSEYKKGYGKCTNYILELEQLERE